MPNVRRGNVAAAFAAIQKASGHVGGNASVRGIPKPRIRTGVLGLDIALGGYFPIGAAVEFWGDPRAGKTTTALRVVGPCQNYCRRCLRPARGIIAVPPESGDENDRWEASGTCDCVARGISRLPNPPPRDKASESAKEYKERCESWAADFMENSYEEFVCLWIDTEETFDASWATRLGVDPRRVLLITPSSAQQASDVVKAMIWSGGVDLSVIDSLAQFTPREEIECSAEDQQQGLGARLVNKMIRTLISGSIEVRNQNNRVGIPHGMSQIWINQVRQKIGVSYGDPSVKPYGLGQGFATKVELRFRTPTVVTKDVKYSGESGKFKETVAETMNIVVEKNTTRSGLRKLNVEYTQITKPTEKNQPGDLDDGKYLFDLAMHHGAIEKKGKAGPYGILGYAEDCKTQAEVRALLEGDFNVRLAVEELIIKRMTHQVI